jgi:hypothetical protein
MYPYCFVSIPVSLPCSPFSVPWNCFPRKPLAFEFLSQDHLLREPKLNPVQDLSKADGLAQGKGSKLEDWFYSIDMKCPQRLVG